MPTEAARITGPDSWSYEEAVRRNRGLVSEAEQQRLAKATVAIAGAGGAGGIHAVTLARMGIGGFRIADPDAFSPVNLNRQAGAMISTLGQNKAEVLARMVRDINPEARVTVFPEAVSERNVDAFLDGADVFVDGIDFFAIEARRLIFGKAREKGLWTLTAGPMGLSVAYLAFSPRGMSFDDYFDVRPGMTREDQLIAFAVGLAPGATHAPYMDLSQVDLSTGAGPSLAAACQLCSGVVGAACLAVLLDWQEPRAAPAYSQFDARRGLLRTGKLRWGNRGPLQRLKRFLLKRWLTQRGVVRAPAGG